MKKNTTFLSSLLLLIAFTLSAQIPAGYYSSAEGKSQATLKTALHLIIKVANVPSYGSGANSTWAAFSKMDIRPEDGTVWDMYSNNHVAFNGNSAASGMNIEHSFAKSWWGDGRQAAQDVQHLCPSNSTANSAKGSWPMAVVDGATTFNNGCIKVGKSSSKSGMTLDAWEPSDEYKGDFARMYMYMVTAYQDYVTYWTGNSVNQLDNNTYPVFEQWTIDMLLKWNLQDPVSQKEITRTNEAYKIQGNRNPFIDYPELAEYIWGTKQNLVWTTTGSSVGLTSPSNASTLNFGTVAFQQTDTASVFIKGLNLKSDLTLAISGLNANLFSLPVTTVSQSNAAAGYKLIISYNAQAIGTHTAKLTISGAEMGNVVVNLQATASDDFMALPATNITASSFTANWSSSANATGYNLDVFTITSSGNTQSVTLMNEEFLSGLPSTWINEGYYDKSTEAGALRMASGKQNCTLTTPALNLSAANNVLSVRAKQYSNDTGAPLTATINGQALAVWVTAADYQTFSVPLPVATTSSTLTFAASSNKRVYLDNVVVGSQAAVQTKTSLSGYPLILGNVLNYNVVDLHANSTYFYTVTPVGNSTGISDRVELKTDFTNATSNYQNNKIYWSVTSEGLLLKQIETGTLISLYDFTGKCLQTVNSQDSNLLLKLNKRGIYLLQLQQNGASNTIKVLY